MNTKNISKILVLALSFSFFIMASAAPCLSVSAEESAEIGLLLSTDSITVTEGATDTFTAALDEGFDASRLVCVVANPNVATVTPIAFVANGAAFAVTYGNGGSTTATVYNIDNPTVSANLTINATNIIMDIPAKLGTNHDNYCELVSYEFVPYDFKYANFNDYKYTLNLKYQCASYNDEEFQNWGCYGYFYDADGNALSKVHLYGSSLAKGKTYHSEFHVPVNAVRFSIEGF